MRRIENNILVYTTKDLEQLFTKKELKRFYHWHNRQPGVTLDSGELGYYAHDVDRFTKFIRFGITTYLLI